MNIFLVGLAVFVGWCICGIINIGVIQHVDGMLSRGEKKGAIAAGLIGTSVLILYGLIYWPVKISCQLGTKLSDFLDRVHKN